MKKVMKKLIDEFNVDPKIKKIFKPYYENHPGFAVFTETHMLGIKVLMETGPCRIEKIIPIYELEEAYNLKNKTIKNSIYHTLECMLIDLFGEWRY